MWRRVSWAWMTAGAIAAMLALPALYPQSSPQSSTAGQKPASQNTQPGQAAKPQNSAPQKAAPGNGNPFPENEESVPVMPTANSPDFSADMNGEGRAAAPAVDKDPVRSPDNEAPGADDSTQGFSSSQSGLGNLTAPPPDDDRGKKKKGDDSALDAFPRETPKEDVSVGNYYMDIKDWHGALSRFQSALVLAPDDPDVYWGLAECERHLGQFAEARANYLKVMEYDPGSHHAKDAKKALRDPEIANAKASTQK